MEFLTNALKVLESAHNSWKNDMKENTKEIRKTLYNIAKEGSIIPNGQLMYNFFMSNGNIDSFYNTDLLTFFVYRMNVPKVLSKPVYDNVRVDFTDMSIDTYSRDIIYYVPHSGYIDPMRLPIARLFIIPDDYELRLLEINGIKCISIDYLFIEWYNLISNPREILALEKWEEISGYRNALIAQLKKNKKQLNGTSILPVGNERRNEKLEKFFHKNESIIMIGDFAINHLLALNGESVHFDHYKVLLMNNVTKNKDSLIKILQECYYKQEISIIMKYHGPKLAFYTKRENRLVLEVFISNEQCVPFFSLHGYQFARIATILKYLHLETPNPVRDALIDRLLNAQDVYLKKEKLTEFDSSPFQMYDVNCLGDYISPMRKKRIKIYKGQISGGHAAPQTPPAFPGFARSGPSA